MIDLYFSPTPNGLKIKLALEEMGLAYRIVPVRLSKGEQHTPAFQAISPNAKIPAIVDHAPQAMEGPVSVFESGAILLYLAQKSGQLMPAGEAARLEALQWLFWQVGGLGPMAGQAGYFRVYAPQPLPEAIERYTREVKRLYGVLDRRRCVLGGRHRLLPVDRAAPAARAEPGRASAPGALVRAHCGPAGHAARIRGCRRRLFDDTDADRG